MSELLPFTLSLVSGIFILLSFQNHWNSNFYCLFLFILISGRGDVEFSVVQIPAFLTWDQAMIGQHHCMSPFPDCEGSVQIFMCVTVGFLSRVCFCLYVCLHV